VRPRNAGFHARPLAAARRPAYVASVVIHNCGIGWSPGVSRNCRLKAELQRGAYIPIGRNHCTRTMDNPAAVLTSREGILLLGPTGSGKTPLGEVLEERGLGAAPCVHFDFGANLREIVARNEPDESIGAQDIALLRRMVQEGLLLEDEHFPLASRILRRFLARRIPAPATWIVLNGLPRHQGQAKAVEGIVAVRTVVYLNCLAPVVAERIRCNAGGDRGAREDDHLEAVRRKLAISASERSPYWITTGAET